VTGHLRVGSVSTFWGALDAVTKEVVTVVNSEFINSLSVCAFLEKLATLRSLPFTAELDSASY
jgi:hypothetical protein